MVWSTGHSNKYVVRMRKRKGGADEIISGAGARQEKGCHGGLGPIWQTEQVYGGRQDACPKCPSCFLSSAPSCFTNFMIHGGTFHAPNNETKPEFQVFYLGRPSPLRQAAWIVGNPTIQASTNFHNFMALLYPNLLGSSLLSTPRWSV